MGCLKPSLAVVCWISFSSHAWGRTRYLTNWDTHHTDGSPCRRCKRGARSSGIARGRYGGRGWRLSTMGSSTTWTSLSWASPTWIRAEEVALKLQGLCHSFSKAKKPPACCLNTNWKPKRYSLYTGRKKKSIKWILEFFPHCSNSYRRVFPPNYSNQGLKHRRNAE